MPFAKNPKPLGQTQEPLPFEYEGGGQEDNVRQRPFSKYWPSWQTHTPSPFLKPCPQSNDEIILFCVFVGCIVFVADIKVDVG